MSEDRVAKKQRCGGKREETASTNEEILALREELAELKRERAATKDFILCTYNEVYARYFPDKSREKVSLWDKLTKELKSDHDIALAALYCGDATVEDLPAELYADQDFMLEAVVTNWEIWYSLPEQFASDIAFARRIPEFKTFYLAEAVFRSHPTLRSDKSMWLKVVRRPMMMDIEIEKLVDLRSFTVDINEANEEARGPAQYRLISNHLRQVMGLLGVSLLQDRDFITRLVSKVPLVLPYLPHETQIAFPDLIFGFFSDLSSELQSLSWTPFWDAMGNEFANELWTNWDVCRAWIVAGGPFLNGKFPEKWKADKEIFRLIAERCPHIPCQKSFGFASSSLRGDKVFMMQVITLQPYLLNCVTSDLERDFDVILCALAGSRDYAQSYLGRPLYLFAEDAMEIVLRIPEKVKAKLEIYDSFFNAVLVGMSKYAGDCPFQLLDEGDETALQRKKLIAEFLGAPTGAELVRLRNAAANIEGPVE